MSRNWAGNLTYRAAEIVRPSTVDEVRKVVAGADSVRALGTRHSFSDLADCPGGTLVELAGLPPVVEVDSSAARARVSGGLDYARLSRELDRAGFALPTLASLPHINVAGACATASHGSGVANPVLSESVAALELVTADGDLARLDRADPDFAGAVVALGALGVVTALELDLVPGFEVAQRVYLGLPLEVLDEHFAELVSCAHSVCLFTDWAGSALTQVWVQQRVGDPEPSAVGRDWFTAVEADRRRHPVDRLDPADCTEQGGVPGRWFERLPHFRADGRPSSGDELQSEYMIDIADAPAALRAVDAVRAEVRPALQVCEVRTVAPDGLWLSPCYGRASASVHFTWDPEPTAALAAVAAVERALEPFDPRPHWAKTTTSTPEAVAARYERVDDFADLVRRYDPEGRFANDFTRRHPGLSP
ncbi:MULTISPECIES: FAD-binding protein [Actinosynnema]|uniref:FAD-binding protein n=1 Tax=Actinosynnema TaxID=40566 RepID=UPI0020A4F459|nr:FAD-binding protein [Actinosynnema pretiosum]MCP2098736.1 xylitol oxidase [Actinosynnema pretiosum]